MSEIMDDISGLTGLEIALLVVVVIFGISTLWVSNERVSGESTCNPKDTFNRWEGIYRALPRAMRNIPRSDRTEIWQS